MFATIAGRYDLLNHLFSGNTDKRWRRFVAKKAAQRHPPAREPFVLDVACGTGDLSLELKRTGFQRVVGIDFCRPMLELAARKSERKLALLEGDALLLPFADASFDLLTIGFGLRNLANVGAGLSELRRVLKPGGTLYVLEFSKPVIPGFSKLFEFYFKRVLPPIGDAVNGRQGAYVYLSDSVQRFPDQKGLVGLMREAGFAEVEYKNLTGGIAALHTGVRANEVPKNLIGGQSPHLASNQKT
ncbi:MAG: class I SAM-dependent methyltransferase [Pyrinomonadaceae bacterium]|nr:class I SAM-dependent methyltransferase [Pyrinomonadaceae bacterium]